MTDQQVRLEAVLAQLENGQVTLPEAAAKFRTLHFPGQPDKSTYQTRADDAFGDPDVPEPGSFAEVESALVAGRITRKQYEVLAEAAVKSVKSDQSTGRGVEEFGTSAAS